MQLCAITLTWNMWIISKLTLAQKLALARNGNLKFGRLCGRTPQMVCIEWPGSPSGQIWSNAALDVAAYKEFLFSNDCESHWLTVNLADQTYFLELHSMSIWTSTLRWTAYATYVSYCHMWTLQHISSMENMANSVACSLFSHVSATPIRYMPVHHLPTISLVLSFLPR